MDIKDQIFEFKEDGFPVKTMIIPFDVLASSKEFIPSSGKPQASRPEASWVLIQNLMHLLDLRQIVNTIDAIYVSADDSFHPLTTEERGLYSEGIPTKLWIFNRLIARIMITTPDGKEPEGMTSSIAIGYNKNGIQIAFGTNVNICSNFSILAGKVFQTYGPNKTLYENLMTEIEQYIDDLPRWQQAEYDMIVSMQNTWVGIQSDIDELVGILLTTAIKANLNGDTSALSITEVSELVREIIRSEPEEFTTVWQLFNLGTFVLNLNGKVNFIDAIDKHVMWRDVILAKYGLPLISI